ncbi:hypothetical protein M427DRAFT_447567 [Gonapodya prolifera JEL478]|uniref:Uncharacterized protein n=1 Tax=Gonapodya prolifera (strain JEL478) TaxID=1344416 RepID=A0A139A386_GONPJ|nr:hypothetical protein M427DRAFT_447567 [Gonapodya prolifera JEL478]|eukprot:KXS11129.1 hypothetical protein M427DRAFT_447567 [Gonapodya prolifera JEL478]
MQDNSSDSSDSDAGTRAAMQLNRRRRRMAVSILLSQLERMIPPERPFYPDARLDLNAMLNADCLFNFR